MGLKGHVRNTITLSNLMGDLDDLLTMMKSTELSVSDDTDPRGWLVRAELYF